MAYNVAGLKIISYNIAGLKRNVKYKDFIDFLQCCDIFILCEAHVSEEELSFVEPFLFNPFLSCLSNIRRIQSTPPW